jgi:hypothetical protein
MALRAIFEFIEFYSRQRWHSSLGNLTPDAYEERRTKDAAQNDTQAASSICPSKRFKPR